MAGFSQASVGSFEPGNLWTTFLIGFGWQGVIAGVGASASLRDKAAEDKQLVLAAVVEPLKAHP